MIFIFLKSLILVSVMFINLVPLVKYEAPEMTIEQMANEVNLSEDEFIFLSSVVEAESNRSTDGDLTGRILIAVTIINRVNSDYFPDTLNGVLTQRNQFSTVRNGHSVTSRTSFSDEAVLEAFELLENEELPNNILFFNCIGFNYGEPFRLVEGEDTIGGNYFMTYGEET